METSRSRKAEILPQFVILQKYGIGPVESGKIIHTYTGSKKITSAAIISSTDLGGVNKEPLAELKLNNGVVDVILIKESGLRSNLIEIECTFEDGTTDTDNFSLVYHHLCLAEGTMITLADKSRKAIEDIEYTDNLLVWDFDNGCFAEAKPLWIKKKQAAQEYNLIKFDNGVELKTILDHRIFNMESQRFTYTMNEEDTPIGTTTFLEDGTTAKIVERKVIRETINYYNIITDYHMNLFANGILTSLRLNNLYKIENMKFVKDNRELVDKSEFEGIPEKYFYGLRLAEQPKEINKGNDVKHTKTLKEYVERILKVAK